MKFEPGYAAIGAAMVLFYLRLLQLRGRKRKEEREIKMAPNRSRRKGLKVDNSFLGQYGYTVGNYYLLVLGIALTLTGLALLTSDVLPAVYKPYWWEITTVGMVSFIFCVK
jgi:hypothetical protein